MLHWTEQRRALRPFGGPYTPDRHPSLAQKNCFSGSANVDTHNTGGWQTGTEKTMIALFTDTGCGEALAYSTDRGQHWTCYDKNPVIKHSGRDPKLVWYAPGKHWVIAVYDEDRDQQIGWAKIGIGGDMPFNQTFTLPLNLTLRKPQDGIRMFANPIKETNTLHDGDPQTVAGKAISPHPVNPGRSGRSPSRRRAVVSPSGNSKSSR